MAQDLKIFASKYNCHMHALHMTRTNVIFLLAIGAPGLFLMRVHLKVFTFFFVIKKKYNILKSQLITANNYS